MFNNEDKVEFDSTMEMRYEFRAWIFSVFEIEVKGGKDTYLSCYQS